MDRQYLSSDDDNDNEFDEVSLPGVGDNEQPTILEVLNRGIVSTEDDNGNGNGNGKTNDTEAKIEAGSTKEVEKRITGDTVNTIKVTSTLEADEELKRQQEPSRNDKERDNLVSSSSSRRRQTEWQKPQRSLAEDEENVFDIESHLIETLNNYSVSEDSESWGVDIKELPPAEGESLDRTTSKIETDPLIGTVFEVEPATPKVLKPIETSVTESGLARIAQIEQIFPEKEVDKPDVVFLNEPVSEQELELEIPLESTKPIWTIVKEVQEQLDVKITSRAETAAYPQTEKADNVAEEVSVDRGNPISKNRPSDDSVGREEPIENKPAESVEKPIAIKVDTDLTKSQIRETEPESRAVAQTEREEPITISEEQRAPSPEDQVTGNATKVSSVYLETEEKTDLSKSQATESREDLEAGQGQAVYAEKESIAVHEETTSRADHNSEEKKSQISLEGSEIPREKEPTKDLESQSEIREEPAQAEIQKSDQEVISTSISVDQVDHSVSIVDPSEIDTNLQTPVPSKDLSESTEEQESVEPAVPQSDHAKSAEKSDTTQPEVKPGPIEDLEQSSSSETNAQSNQITTPTKTNLAFNPFQSVKVVSEVSETQDSGGSTVDDTQLLDTTKTEIESTAPDPQITVNDEVATDTTNDDTKTDLQSKKLESRTPSTEESTALSKEIDQKLSELTTHLTKGSKVDLNGNISKETKDIRLDVNGLPVPKTAQEEEQRQQFLDSLPQISAETDSNKVAALAKREYYQSLRQYLINHSDKPPIPPETYRWEDLRRAKQRGGYPWTHLYKRPLGPEEEPEIVLLLRKSQELRFSESPKSIKKVRIDDQVSIKETERYIQELSDTEDNPPTEDEKEEQEDAQSECISCVSDSVLTCEKRASKLGKIRGILKKRSPKKEPDARSLPDTSSAPRPSFSSNHKSEEDIRERPSRRPIKEAPNKAKCFPIMKKLRSMADRQKKNFQNIKKISLKKDEKISLEEEQKIIKLKTSPKAERSEIPHFIEKQDSDDVLEIVELDESPSRKRKDQLELQEQAAAAISAGSVVVPDEIIEIPTTIENDSDRQQTPEPTVSEILEEELRSEAAAAPPKKTARLRREHVYEDIEAQNGEAFSEEIDNILEIASVEALKQSLAKQDSSTLKDVEATKTALPLERMGSSEEEVERSHLAPISSIDSASSEDERKPHLSTVAEESDDTAAGDKEVHTKLKTVPEVVKEYSEHIPWNDIELKPALKKEPSPSPSDKKVTFSHVEDEAEPHREDIELPEGLSGIASKRWSNLR